MAIRAVLNFVEEDLEMVNLFHGQPKLENSLLEFADHSVREPFDSTNAWYRRSAKARVSDAVSLRPDHLSKQVGELGTEQDTGACKVFNGRLAVQQWPDQSYTAPLGAMAPSDETTCYMRSG